MLLYRAINDFSDAIEINKGCGMKASNPITPITSEVCLQSVASHVASGSNPNVKDCWISSTKDFKICACEFSIPQMGGYNTANQRKEIAVINRNKLINKNTTYVSNGNYTYIRDGNIELDMCDSSNFPSSIKPGPHKTKIIISPSGKIYKVNNKLMNGQVSYFKNFLKKLGNIDTFILDITFKTPSDRKSNYVPINEFSFIDYYHHKIILPSKGVPITSGLFKNFSEVLILNKIPANSIIKVLTFLETDILYVLNNTFRFVLDDIVSGSTAITTNGNSILINGIKLNLNNDEQWLANELYNRKSSMIDLVYSQYVNNGSNNIKDVLSIYNNLKNTKRNIIRKILFAINQKHSGNIVEIVEDTIYVAIKGNNLINNNPNVLKLCKYDLLLIGDTNGTVYRYATPGYPNIWNQSLNSDFTIMDNNGVTFNCRFV